MTCHQHHRINTTISSREQVDELASELADDYIEYFNIDTKNEVKRYEDLIEECLAHLEEVISALDSYKQKGPIIDTFVQTITSKNEHLNKLYEQVDSIEQYIFETNRLLNNLDQSLRELESRRPTGSSSKIKQILGYIPRGIPRLSIFSGIIDNERAPHFQQQEEGATSSNSNDGRGQLKPISDILNEISQIESDMDKITTSLNKRLSLEINGEEMQKLESSAPALSLDPTTVNVDNSWQELL